MKIKPLLKLVNALNDNTSPGEIAHGVAIGLILGFMPKGNLLWIAIFIIMMFIRIQKGAYFLFMILGMIISPALDVTFHQIGLRILTEPKMIDFYAKILEVPLVAFTKFNNTVVMGSLVFGLACYVPVYFLSRLFIKLWRIKLGPAFRKTKVFAVLSKVPFLQRLIYALGR